MLQMGGVVLPAMIGLVGVKLHLPSPYCIWQNMIVASIFLFGTACAESGLTKYLKHPVTLILSIIIVIYALWSGMHIGCQATAINDFTMWYPIVFLSGISIIYYICHYIKELRIGTVFAYIGEFSFSIMALHFVAFKVVTFVHHCFNPQVDTSSFPTSEIDLIYGSPLYMVAGIILPIVCSKLYSRANAWRNYCVIQKSGADN